MTFFIICDRINTDLSQKGVEQTLLLPQKLNPAFKDYIWGGTKLKEQFSKSCSFEKIAESWELSCHEDGPSVIAGSNQTLTEYIKENGKEILGTYYVFVLKQRETENYHSGDSGSEKGSPIKSEAL